MWHKRACALKRKLCQWTPTLVSQLYLGEDLLNHHKEELHAAAEPGELGDARVPHRELQELGHGAPLRRGLGIHGLGVGEVLVDVLSQTRKAGALQKDLLEVEIRALMVFACGSRGLRF